MPPQRWPCRQVTEQVCAVAECGREPYARMLCRMHYQRWRKHGDPMTLKRPSKAASTTCSIGGCSKPHLAKGLCRMHYQRWKRNGDPLLVHRDRFPSDGCSVSGCSTPPTAKGLCVKHYRRWKQTGDPLGISEPPVRCLVCDDSRVGDIDAHLRRGDAQVEVAKRFEFKQPMMSRHARRHLDNPAWHAKRAAWWATELRTMTAFQHQEQTA